MIVNQRTSHFIIPRHLFIVLTEKCLSITPQFQIPPVFKTLLTALLLQNMRTSTKHKQSLNILYYGSIKKKKKYYDQHKLSRAHIVNIS